MRDLNLSYYYDLPRLEKESARFTGAKVFFLRVCGTGMGAAAVLLKQAGVDVYGADQTYYPPMSEFLQQTAIKLIDWPKVTEEFLKTFDLIVVGNVIGRNTETAIMIERLGVPFCSFPAALGAFVLNKKEVIGIAGTHGKTTTTYMGAQIFEKLGEKPGFFIGGVLPDGRAMAQVGEGKYFFIESDEYDSSYFEKYSKFLSYQIDHLILTSLEFDHADIYRNLDEIVDQFKGLIPQLQKGHYIYESRYPATVELAQYYKTPHQHAYPADLTITHVSEKGSHFSFSLEGKKYEWETNVIGEHNISNLTSILVFALLQKFSKEELQGAITDLKMVKRRQEVRGKFLGNDVIDDFAHHPTAIKLTLDGLRKRYPTKKVLTVFEPQSATSRSDIFQKDFAESFKASDVTILAMSAKANTVTSRGAFDGEKCIQDMREQGQLAYISHNLSELQDLLAQYLLPNEFVCVILSNGTCQGLWESDFVNKLV
jgi:UDP-N-acetylmuramate: L-alanyl-gamma-D-glutamyl-meso-diaminopimelate ligase